MLDRITIIPGIAAITIGLTGAHGADLPSQIEVHPDLEISLFAHEPDVVDPVALCFDAAGRLYVVEMRDYPYGLPPENKSGGTVRLLEDTDHDGRADRSVLFAENLSCPMSIAPFRDGVIVTAPPGIILLRDTNHDGKADVREVLYSGFRRAATDSNTSGLRWGLDNWLHGVNGGNGGEVVSTRKRGESLRLGDLDFRMRPDSGEIETTYSTGGGFGLVFDQWGRSFTPHNVNHIQMRIMSAAALGRNPGLPPVEGTESISDHAEMSRIYPISEAQTRPNHPEQAGYFSAAGAIGFIGDEEYPGDLAGSVTVADMVGNLVHRDVLSADGPILKANRAPGEQAAEFIASTDPAFRPTALELGPDGALYLLDMQRDVIEHPDFIPKKILEKLDIRAGEDRGRIYRIVPKAGLKQNTKALASMTPAELVEELSSPNQWRRITAQRLIVEFNHLVTTAPLEDVVKSNANPIARVHALWTLRGLGELGESILLVALQDSDARAVENAIQVASTFTDPGKAVRDRIQTLALNHPNARVRFMAATRFDLPPDAVLRLLRLDGHYRWSRVAALSALHRDEHGLLKQLLAAWKNTGAADASRLEVLREVATLVGSRESPGSIAAAIENLEGQPADCLVTILEGLGSGLTQRAGKLTDVGPVGGALEKLAKDESQTVRKGAWKLEHQLGLPASATRVLAVNQALETAVDAGSPITVRQSAVELLALAKPAQSVPVLLGLFTGKTPVDLQRAAFEVLRQPTDPAIADGLLARWRSIHPNLKRGVVSLLLGRRAYQSPLLDAIESGSLKLGELNLDLEDRRRLISWSSPEIQQRARKLIGDGEYGNRQAKVGEWLAKLPAQGNAAQGRIVFEKTCAQCHRVGDLGHEVGPNLTGVSWRSVEDLVSNILDPNMAINPNYLSVSAETRDGELLSGILVAETPDAITMLQPQGIRTSLPRNQIARLESSGTSLMPEGLETTMQPADLRDLVAFLQETK